MAEKAPAEEAAVIEREPVAEREATEAPAAIEREVASRTAALETEVLGSTLGTSTHEVIDGETIVIPIAELADGELELSVVIDALAKHGVVSLVTTPSGCELHYASVAGCIGSDPIEVEMEIDGVATTHIFDINVVEGDASPSTTTTTTTTVATTTTKVGATIGNQPSTLAFTGVTIGALIGAGLTLLLGGTLLVVRSRRMDGQDEEVRDF